MNFKNIVWIIKAIYIRNILLIESIQRRAAKFLCKYPNASYKERRVLLNLLPLNYWLEYLDLVFFFKCNIGLLAIDLCKYVTFATGSTRRGSSGLNLKYNCIARTSSFRDTYFIRIVKLGMLYPIISTASPFLVLLKVS